MWNKIKQWFKGLWANIKSWVGKNKAWLIAVGTAFASGLAIAFGIVTKRNARIAKHIDELEDRLADYEGLNSQLAKLNSELAKRLDGLERGNDELRRQNIELGKVVTRSTVDIEYAKSDLARARQAIVGGELATDEIDRIAGRLQEESRAIDDGIERLAKFLEKYGATNQDI